MEIVYWIPEIEIINLKDRETQWIQKQRRKQKRMNKYMMIIAYWFGKFE